MLDEVATPIAVDDAFRRTLLRHLDEAFRLAAFILRDRVAAEDAVQEAAMLAWDRRRSLRDSAAIEGWFTRIVVNVCRDELRRRARRPTVVELDAVVVSGLAAPEARRGDPELAAALARLEPDEQALLALRFGRDLTIPELSIRLAIPEGTAKSRLHHALRHLRAALDAERRHGEVQR
ncbi:MAG TPA: sigma-70 family RNA polymerase sigma factor [Candidatus Limnocylindrales bacterium]